MPGRRFLNLVFSSLMVASMLMAGGGQAIAQRSVPEQPTPPTITAPGQQPAQPPGTVMSQQKRMTNEQRRDAAIRAEKARKALGGEAAKAVPGTNTTMLAPKGSTAPATTSAVPTGTHAPLATPDYFGIVGNYANSPLPTSVSIQGDGFDAFATATLGSGGAVTGFTIVNGGSGYTFADVVVMGGGGSGGTGTATIDPVTGAITAIAVATPGLGYGTVPGMRKFVDGLPQLATSPGCMANGVSVANDLLQCLPVAIADTTLFSGTISANNPAADYYEIAAIQYRLQLHADLPPVVTDPTTHIQSGGTDLRLYVQIETPANQAVSLHVPLYYPDGTPITKTVNGVATQILAVDYPQYLGPVILTQENRPVRIKFDNYLPKGTGGDLFIPVDPTDMGAGYGPTDASGNPCDPMAVSTTCASYSQNRADVHLHGGVTPWISDGTPDQWTTPAGSTETYPKGVSVHYVPDQWYDANGDPVPQCAEHTTCSVPGATTDPGQGSMTLYYTNQQSARLMFYHDHSYGITRLNVYAGMAAGYLVSDPVEQVLVNGGNLPLANGTTLAVPAGTIPAAQLPLVIQDKVFVPSPTQLAAQDPTWDTTAYGGYGNLWFPHVYVTNQNPWDISGANGMGRWDYGAWFWPPWQAIFGQLPNPYCLPTPPASGTATSGWDCSQTGEPPFIPGTPNPSLVPEAFVDTMMVNGTPFPKIQVQPQAYRLRILNASNDRTLNLQLYQAGVANANPSLAPTFCNGDVWSGTTLNSGGCSGEVPMAPAVRNTPGTMGYVYPDELDGRLGGVPDVRAAGPSFIQIGTEGGFLSHPVVLPNRPVGYNYNRRDIVVLNVSTKTLMLGPAERADVIVDFSQFAGKTVIVYNDSPAPVPAFDSRNDYFTYDQDQVMSGGAPTTQPGYGPNTRTVLQFQVAASTPAPAYDTTALNAAIPAAYALTQAAPVVPEQAYDQAFGTTSPADPYIRIQDMSHAFKTGTVVSFTVTAAGSGYTSDPIVKITGGGGAGATATATLSGTGISSLGVVNPGAGYTSAPNVTISPPDLPGGVQATAVATISSSVANVTVAPGGAGYTSAPNVTFSAPSGAGGTTATGTTTLSLTGVASVSLTNAGGSYTTAPNVTFNPAGATATAVLGPAPIATFNMGLNGAGYTAAPAVTFSSGTAVATATLQPTGVGSLINFASGDTVYATQPSVAFSQPQTSGSAPTAVANLAATGSVGAINVTNGGTGYTTAPQVTIGAPQIPGTQATAIVDQLSPTGVGAVRLTNGGSCSLTTSFQVTFDSVNGAGSGAVGTASVGGRPRRVTGVLITNPGSGYTLPPTPNFSAGTWCTGVTGTSSLVATSILTVKVTTPGSGYTSAPKVGFNGGAGTGAAANAVLGRLVASVTLTTNGSGYTAAPAVSFTGGSPFSGTTAPSVTAVLQPTGVAGVTINTGQGGSYTTAPGVTIAQPTGCTINTTTCVQATATAVLGPAPVASVTMGNPGSYVAAPQVTFDPGLGNNTATGVAALIPTSVASVNVTAPGGSGYNSAPAVTIDPPAGCTLNGTTCVQAQATATLTPVGISALTLTFAGSGYSAATVTVDPPSGCTINGTSCVQATGNATISPGSVSGFVITNPGSGYVSPPTFSVSGGGGTGASGVGIIATQAVTVALQPKGIQELFEGFYNRMNATLSVEIPNSNGTNQTTIPYGYVDPPTEIVNTNAGADALISAGGQPLAMLPDGAQLWKFTHNGVDTHSLHFHLFNLQLINRVGWDGMIRPPEANELGWKETIRMNPLEDALVAIKPIVPALPWQLPNSIRPLDVTSALGSGNDPSGIIATPYQNVDPGGNPIVVTNHLVNLGWEYVVHCHLLGHEENDMMRMMSIGVAPVSPAIGSATSGSGGVSVTFTDNSINETGFTLQRATDPVNGPWTNVGTLVRPAPVWNANQTVTDSGLTTATTETVSDPSPVLHTTNYYRVIANDVVGDTTNYGAAPIVGYPSDSIDSVPSGVTSVAIP